ncbi:MAG: YfhO family protein, partial [bacterium]|nr:YfhO family protein [bacterium]
HLLKVDFEPKQTIFLEEKTDWGAQGALASTVQFEKYGDQEVVIKVESSADGFLFLSDTYFPGWKAYLLEGEEGSGKKEEIKIYRANYAFRAVEVPKGQHKVVFRFEPTSFWWGIRISLISGILTILGILVLLLKELKFLKRLKLRKH